MKSGLPAAQSDDNAIEEPPGRRSVSPTLLQVNRRISKALALLLLVAAPALAGGAPLVKSAVAPKYPTLTLAGRIYGEVQVRVAIDPRGAVQDVHVISGHPMLREAAVAAAKQWKFEPSTASKRSTLLTFKFVILPPTSEVRSETVFLPPTGIEIRQKPADPEVEQQQGDTSPESDPISKT